MRDDAQGDDPEPKHRLIRGGDVVFEPPLAEGVADNLEVFRVRAQLDPCVLPAGIVTRVRPELRCAREQVMGTYFCARSPEPSRCQCSDHSAVAKMMNIHGFDARIAETAGARNVNNVLLISSSSPRAIPSSVCASSAAL